MHTHPIKRPTDIAAALRFGIRRFVVDNPDELRKFTPPPQACGAAAARIVPQSRPRSSTCRASSAASRRPSRRCSRWPRTSGSPCAGCPSMSGRRSPTRASTSRPSPPARDLMREARRDGFGGPRFPRYRRRFPRRLSTRPVAASPGSAQPIRQALAHLPRTTRVIAEPGRFIAAPAGIGVAAVMGRAQREGRWWYYLDDGLYGSYSGQLYDHAHYPLETLGGPGCVTRRCSPARPATAST